MKKRESMGSSHNKKGMGILMGIPILCFTVGLALVTLGVYDNLTYAFYISRMFIGHEQSAVNTAYDFDKNTEEIKEENTEEEVKEKKRIFPNYGEEFGVLVAETADINYPVFNGDSYELLQKGIGHYFGSRYPGENSNVVLAGHRNSLFKNLWKLEIGEKVIFKADYGGEEYEYEYKVVDIIIVKRKDEEIVYPTEKERLTLYTCYPFNYIGNAPKRYVVICDLVSGTPMDEIVEKRKAEEM